MSDSSNYSTSLPTLFIICHLIVVILAVVKWYPFVVLIYISPSWLMMLNVFACVYSPFSTFYGEISIWIFFPLSLFFLICIIDLYEYIFVCPVPLETVWYKNISFQYLGCLFIFLSISFPDLSICLSGQFVNFLSFQTLTFSFLYILYYFSVFIWFSTVIAIISFFLFALCECSNFLFLASQRENVGYWLHSFHFFNISIHCCKLLSKHYD